MPHVNACSESVCSFRVIAVLLLPALLSACVEDDADVVDPVLPVVVAPQVAQGGHDYVFVRSVATWHAAQAFCANYDLAGGGGYHLVTVNDAVEEQFLNRFEIYAQRSPWWIGYSDEVTPGAWTWANGSSTYTHWAPGQPSTWGHCAIDLRDSYDTWGTRPCDQPAFFVCERDAPASSSKGSFWFSRASTDNAHTNTETLAVTLSAGQILTAGTCGLAGGAVASGSTWIRIKRDGVDVGSSDEGSLCRYGSLSIAAATPGVYVIHAGCINNTACSGTVAWQY
ncbi:C-type lectin domain-containing protein [Sorangium sp. So ce136]|uniref:C-type lectin domain-containing protein n=1 Tax=Sorangium sp. So ce136 TaxID=3133284 RepID=UPI003F02CADF